MCQTKFTFYEIKSRKSETTSEGRRQISLACEVHPNVFCFLWVDSKNQLLHLQLVIEEFVLEWNQMQGVRCSQTNRILDFNDKIGVRKGSRSLHDLDDSKLVAKTMGRLSACVFPKEWDSMIRKKFA